MKCETNVILQGTRGRTGGRDTRGDTWNVSPGGTILSPFTLPTGRRRVEPSYVCAPNVSRSVSRQAYG